MLISSCRSYRPCRHLDWVLLFALYTSIPIACSSRSNTFLNLSLFACYFRCFIFFIRLLFASSLRCLIFLILLNFTCSLRFFIFLSMLLFGCSLRFCFFLVCQIFLIFSIRTWLFVWIIFFFVFQINLISKFHIVLNIEFFIIF